MNKYALFALLTINACPVFGMEQKEQETIDSALIREAFDAHPNKIEELLKKGASAKALTDNGWTALHSTANTTIALKLCKAGAIAIINAQTSDKKYTPLMVAAMRGNKEMVKFLLKKGANKSLTDKYGRTAAELAAPIGQLQTGNCDPDPELVKLLK